MQNVDNLLLLSSASTQSISQLNHDMDPNYLFLTYQCFTLFPPQVHYIR